MFVSGLVVNSNVRCGACSKRSYLLQERTLSSLLFSIRDIFVLSI